MGTPCEPEYYRIDSRSMTSPAKSTSQLRCIEICAGTGGQALGLALAGFQHAALVEIDQDACATLRSNRPEWPIINDDIRSPERFVVEDHVGIDLLAGGVPCPPFSVAGKQLGSDDERDLFPAAIRLIEVLTPRAIMLENVRGLMAPRFTAYRRRILRDLASMGYADTYWDVVNASTFGVPQLRPRSVLVAFREPDAQKFRWPEGGKRPQTVGETLRLLMAENGWRGADRWAEKAAGIAPTLVGGSRKHGGPDLGPTRAKSAWKALGVDAHGVADVPPPPGFPKNKAPKLTVRMAAALQGFPNAWVFAGRKTSAYRQVGNAFPPPVAQAFGEAIRDALLATTRLALVDLSSLRRTSGA